jgi:hypothetical protein
VEAFVLQATRHIQDRGVDHRHLRVSCTFLAALIAISIVALPNASAFADISPVFNGNATAARVDNTPVQLAQANLPSGVGSLDDYMRQNNDGPSGAAVPQPGYSPQAVPPQSNYPQGVPSQEWNYGYADPNSQRTALIGAAVVGALAVGLWAWQQHEQQQNLRYGHPRRRHARQHAFDN